jgi:large subunit ribosomal protein L13
MGKNKVYYTPFLDCGDNVIIINAGKILLSGKKNSEKIFLHHTGYPGGQRFNFSKTLLTTDPCRMLMHALKGMLPKNKLGRKMLTNVRFFAGENHNMDSVKPENYKIKY